MNEIIKEEKTDLLYKCDIIKVTMMLLVILGHSLALWRSSGWFNQEAAEKNIIFDYIATILENIHNYNFVFISGYIFYYSKFECGKYNNFFYDIVKRAKRLLIPYMFVSIIWVAPFKMLFYKCDISDIIYDFVLAIGPSQLWFIWMIFLLFVIFHILGEKIEDSNLVTGLIVAIVLYGVGIIGSKFIPNIFQIWSACKYFLFYYMGFILRKNSKYVEKIIIDTKNKYIILLVIIEIIVSSIYFICKINDFSKILIFGTRFLSQIIGVITVVCVFEKINLKRIMNNSLYIFLKRYNFGMYLFHQQILYVSITAFNGKVSSVVLGFANFIIASICSALITYILSKSRATSFLIGLRQNERRI